jgi:hypothetical protein
MELTQLTGDQSGSDKSALKYQADHLAKTLWRLAHDRIYWQSAAGRTPENARTVEKRVGRIVKPGFVVIEVQSSLYLGVATHHLRLWRSDYAKFYTSLSEDELHSLETYLLAERCTAAFYLRKRERRMYRAEDTDEALERALLKLTAKCERVRPALRHEQEKTA